MTRRRIAYVDEKEDGTEEWRNHTWRISQIALYQIQKINRSLLCVGQMKYEYTVLVGKPDGERPYA
jgi:hypothetical protein